MLSRMLEFKGCSKLVTSCPATSFRKINSKGTAVLQWAACRAMAANPCGDGATEFERLRLNAEPVLADCITFIVARHNRPYFCTPTVLRHSPLPNFFLAASADERASSNKPNFSFCAILLRSSGPALRSRAWAH
jgi:hypothetical protein